MPTKKKTETAAKRPAKATPASTKSKAGPKSARGGSKAAAKQAALARRPQDLTLVTGGTGFLGRHLLTQLVEAGEKNLRVLTTSAPAWLEGLGVETVEGSITDAGDVARAVEGVGSIYHLAGRVSLDRDGAHEMYRLHVEGTRLLCGAAHAAGVREIVLASTSGTLAVSKDAGVVSDETWPAPLDIFSRWPYYASKFYQERAALEHFTGAGHRLVIVNPSLLLGPGDDRLSSTKVVLDFLARKIMAVPGGGLSFVDVRDAATVLRVAMRRGRHGERYLVSAANWTFEKFFGRLITVEELEAMTKGMPKSEGYRLIAA
ncbi:MAG: NAD-dependent epimerase/dehydratase family protein, partial [Acidobacteria bacterium]|nr:NAD-dependent epimerase/dehydratase family protein [Acidobacteriota bacterium]